MLYWRNKQLYKWNKYCTIEINNIGIIKKYHVISHVNHANNPNKIMKHHVYSVNNPNNIKEHRLNVLRSIQTTHKTSHRYYVNSPIIEHHVDSVGTINIMVYLVGIVERSKLWNISDILREQLKKHYETSRGWYMNNPSNTIKHLVHTIPTIQ